MRRKNQTIHKSFVYWLIPFVYCLIFFVFCLILLSDSLSFVFCLIQLSISFFQPHSQTIKKKQTIESDNTQIRMRLGENSDLP